MPIPIMPIAGIALRYGGIALAGYAIARATSHGRLDQQVEDIMDDTPEGLTMRTDDGQWNTTLRWRRAFRLNRSAKGVQIDATALTRLKVTPLQ